MGIFSASASHLRGGAQCIAAPGIVAALLAFLTTAAGAAFPLTQDRDELFRQSLKQPANITLALDYAKACVELQDYEGAIGALERILFYRPDDAEIKAQLGILYFKLHSHQMAIQYFDQAAAGKLADVTRTKIAALKPESETEAAGQRVFAYLQTGVRYQSNASFNPDNNTLRLANQDFLFTHPSSTGSDWNGFQLLQAGYDHSLGNQRGDTLELRVTGYSTEQFRLTDLNVGFYDFSIGPRLALAPEALPGWTIKPYAVGGQVFLAGSRYLASGGAGLVADIPLRSKYVIEPGVEVRHVQFDNVSVFSSLNTGTTATVSLSAQATIDNNISIAGRLLYTKDDAAQKYQTSDNFAEELALIVRLAPLIHGLGTSWSVSPYVKLLQTRFDAPNPYIDDTVTRHDQEVQVGVVLDTPISGKFGLVTNVQYATVDSNIPNYRVRNFSVLSGPTVRF